MIYCFDGKVAKEHGVIAAVILYNLDFWIKKNKANEKHFYDGTYWTYNSARAFTEVFEFLSERQIQACLKKLVEDGILITGNYNKIAYDRTLWYAITEKGYSILRNGGMETTKMSNGTTQIVEPIPDINTNINKDIINIISKQETKKSNGDTAKTKTKVFAIPTIDEIKEYCKERKNNVDAEKFFDYYESKGWLVGKTKMKNWQAAIRNWEKNSFDNGNKKQELKTHNHNEFANFEEYDFLAEFDEILKEEEAKKCLNK